MLAASVAFGTPALVAGLDLLGGGDGAGLTVSQLILAAPVGIVFATILLVAAAWSAADNGVPVGLLLRPSLGVAGSWAATALLVAFLIGWIGLQLEFAGAALNSALEQLGVGDLPDAVPIVILAIAAGGFMIIGLAWVTQVWLYRFAFWGALLLVALLAWQYLTGVDFDPLLDVTPLPTNFWPGVDAIVALGIIWFPIVADTARFAATPSAAASGAGTGFSVPALMLVFVGGLRAAAAGVADDPATLLLDAGTTVTLLILAGWLVIGGINQTFMFGFSAATGLSTVSDWFAGRIQAIVLIAVGAAVALWVPGEVVADIAALIVVFIAQLLAVLLSDFFVVRRRYYETDELYRRKGTYSGVNLYGLVSVLVGFITATVLRPVGPGSWVSFVDGIIPGDVPIAESAGLPALLISMAVAFAVYMGLGRWKIHERVMVSKIRV